jgi:hypothetical protein
MSRQPTKECNPADIAGLFGGIEINKRLYDMPIDRVLLAARTGHQIYPVPRQSPVDWVVTFFDIEF